MTWKIILSQAANKDLQRIDNHWADKILAYLTQRIALLDDPTVHGKHLRSNLIGLYRYRVGDYRIICQIKGEEIEILVVSIGHRSTVYR